MSVGRGMCLFIELPPSETGRAILPAEFYRRRLVLQGVKGQRYGRLFVNLSVAILVSMSHSGDHSFKHRIDRMMRSRKPLSNRECVESGTPKYCGP